MNQKVIEQKMNDDAEEEELFRCYKIRKNGAQPAGEGEPQPNGGFSLFKEFGRKLRPSRLISPRKRRLMGGKRRSKRKSKRKSKQRQLKRRSLSGGRARRKRSRSRSVRRHRRRSMRGGAASKGNKKVQKKAQKTKKTNKPTNMSKEEYSLLNYGTPYGVSPYFAKSFSSPLSLYGSSNCPTFCPTDCPSYTTLTMCPSYLYGGKKKKRKKVKKNKSRRRRKSQGR